jgi:hypothetical protein
MSDDKKNKSSKQVFFRINSKGELTQTNDKTNVTASSKDLEIELKEPELKFEDHPTEVQPKEPSAPSIDRENTEADFHLEPNQITLAEEKNTTEPESLVFKSQDSNPEPLVNAESPTNLESPFGSLEQFEEVPVPIHTSAPAAENDIATLRNYIALKEKEVGDLKEQQKQYQNVLLKLKRTHGETLDSNQNLQRELATSQANEQLIKKELSQLREKHDVEIAILKNDFELNQKQQGNYQEQIEDLNRQKNIWKEKISEDLKKIKLKEKELENRYELLKKDTETLLDSKDNQVLELKKKSDALELELESLEDRLRSEHAILNSIEGKKRRLIETLKLAISLLEEIDSESDVSEERKTG